MMEKFLLAFDFGGTKLTAALTTVADSIPGQQRWLDLRRVLSPPGAEAAYDIETMVRLGRALLAGRPLTAIGVSFGGPVDYAAGMVQLSHHVPGWEDMPLAAMLAAEFGVPVGIDNDANVAALGEHRFGAGRGRDSLFYITVSTGVGGGWVLDGRSWRGHEGMAGEIGHTIVDPNGPLCLCGKRGCVERLASGPYMAADWSDEQVGRGAGELVGDDFGVGEMVTGRDVAEMAAQGDEAARRILRRGARALGTGIGNAANLINPQLFVLGGGVTKSGELWWETVRRTAHGTAMPEVHFDIVSAELGDDAPLWGAIALLMAEELTG